MSSSPERKIRKLVVTINGKVRAINSKLENDIYRLSPNPSVQHVSRFRTDLEKLAIEEDMTKAPDCDLEPQVDDIRSDLDELEAELRKMEKELPPVFGDER